MAQAKSAKAKLTPKPSSVPLPAVTLPVAASAVLASPTDASDLYARTIALSLDRSKFGNRRKASMTGVSVDADKHLLNLTKRLLTSDELKAITTLDQEAQAFLNDRAVPSFFKPGIYLVPLALVEAVDAQLTAFRDQRLALVDALVAVY